MKKLIVGCLLAAMAAGVALVNADTHRWGEDAYSKKETNIDYPTNRNFQRGWLLYGEGKFDEAFGSGTAAVISPIGELKYGDKHMVINDGKIGPISQKLYDTLTGIQWGRLPDEFGWTVKVD